MEDSRSLVSRKLSAYQLLCHHNFVQQYCWLWSLWNQFIEWYYLFTIWAISLWYISLEEYCSSMSIMNCAPELSYLIGYQCLLLTYKTLRFHCMRVCMCVCASVCVCVCVLVAQLVAWPTDWTLVSLIPGRFYTVWDIREDQIPLVLSILALMFSLMVKSQSYSDMPTLELDFLGSSDCKESACNAGYPGLIPRSIRSPGEGNGNPIHYSCLENSMDRGAWWTTVHGVTNSRTWLSD